MKGWQNLALMLATVLFAGMWQNTLAQASDTEAKAREQLKSDLRDVISSWASAWQSQFDDVYLLHYHPQFKPEGFASLDAWQRFRRSQVKDPGTINIDLTEFELVEAHEDAAVVRFWLTYSRPGYADRTHKEMQLRLQGHIWMIEKEHNLAVSKLAPPALALGERQTLEEEQTQEVELAQKEELVQEDSGTTLLLSEWRQMIASWAGAWQSHKDDQYFSHYLPKFKPEGFASRNAWQQSRRVRVREPGAITIALNEFELVKATQDTAVVRFWLTYSRPGYADRTHKEMQLRLQDHVWMIEKEHNLTVTKLASP